MLHRLPPLSAWSSALIAALIGFGGTVALVVKAMTVLGASVDQTGSAVTALCCAIAAAGALLTLRLRMPIVLAWSTPGAALLAAMPPGVAWQAAIGAFTISGALMVALGAVPLLGRLAARIPAAVATAMLAGVLLPFCLGLFRAAAIDPLMVGIAVAIFLVARQRAPVHATLLVLAAGILLSILRHDIAGLPPGATLGLLIPTAPRFDLAAMMSIALPLFLVTLVSQNLPGLVVLRTAGYEPRSGILLAGTGLASIAMAPFGAHAINLAAITAAICTSSDAHPDPARRWIVGMLYAGFYLVLALFAPLLVRLFLALPPSTIATLTGVALIPALTGALEAALAQKEDRDAAMVTFLVTGSGVVLGGLGGAFWGLIAGFAALGAKRIARGAAADRARG